MAPNSSYPRASTPPPSLPSRAVAPAIEMNLSRARSYLHEDIYKAYMLLITSVADDLHDEDVSKIVFVQDLPQNQSWKALDVMQCLEKRGKFSCYEIEPLEQLLRDANRCDLVMKYVTEYKRLYGGVASEGRLTSGRGI